VRDFRPRLAKKASLRHDRFTGQDIVLYPERGLSLNPVAAAVARRCDGTHTLDEIVAAVRTSFPDAPPGEVARDVAAFLERLRERGLLEGME
jgi:coenzyme PQQ biosynthesis protein PqqD